MKIVIEIDDKGNVKIDAGGVTIVTLFGAAAILAEYARTALEAQFKTPPKEGANGGMVSG